MHTLRKYFLVFLVVLIVAAGATFAIIQLFVHHDEQSDVVASEPEPAEVIPEDPIPEFIDLQSTVDAWLNE